MLFSLTLNRVSWMVMLVGLAAFAVSYGALTLFAGKLTTAAITAIPETVLMAIVAVVAAQLAISVTGAVIAWHQSQEIRQVRPAIDSMPQGMCMFDASERLVVCNSAMRCRSSSRRLPPAPAAARS